MAFKPGVQSMGGKARQAQNPETSYRLTIEDKRRGYKAAMKKLIAAGNSKERAHALIMKSERLRYVMGMIAPQNEDKNNPGEFHIDPFE